MFIGSDEGDCAGHREARRADGRSKWASCSLFTNCHKNLFAVLSISEQYLASSITVSAEQAVAAAREASSVTIAMAFESDPFSQNIRAGAMEDAANSA